MKPRNSVLRYQVRYGDGGEPETLIAADVVDALQQARRRADLNKATVALWKDGSLIAECAPSPGAMAADGSADLVARLVDAGVYIFTAPSTAGSQSKA